VKLSKTEYVVTAYAERAAGPGWSNRPLWVVIRDSANGAIRQDCLQPSEQTDEMHLLYNISAEVHAQLKHAVETRMATRKRRAG
jgi:hypothetical protein